MAKVAFGHLKRPKNEPGRFEFEHPDLPEPLVLWLRPLDALLEDKARDRSEDLIARYVRGGFVHPATGEWQEKPIPYPPIDGQEVVLCESTLRVMAMVETMQKPPKPEDVYTVEDDLVPCAVLCPEVWAAIQSKAFDVRRGNPEGKAPEDGSAQPSED